MTALGNQGLIPHGRLVSFFFFFLAHFSFLDTKFPAIVYMFGTTETREKFTSDRDGIRDPYAYGFGRDTSKILL